MERAARCQVRSGKGRFLTSETQGVPSCHRAPRDSRLLSSQMPVLGGRGRETTVTQDKRVPQRHTVATSPTSTAESHSPDRGMGAPENVLEPTSQGSASRRAPGASPKAQEALHNICCHSSRRGSAHQPAPRQGRVLPHFSLSPPRRPGKSRPSMGPDLTIKAEDSNGRTLRPSEPWRRNYTRWQLCPSAGLEPTALGARTRG